MRFSTIERAFERQALKGHAKEEHVPLLTAVTALEMGAESFYRAYFGDAHWGKAEKDVIARREAVQGAKDSSDALLEKWTRTARDASALESALARETIVTTLDLPAVLGRARDLVIREAEEPYSTESPLFAGAAKVTRPDFRPRKSIKKEFDTLGLFPQPEGTNVRYEAFSFSEDEYAVTKYSRAIGWTYEARVNDDLTGFLDQAATLGYAARMTRIKTLAAAIVAGTSRSTPSGGAGGPTIANIEYARDTLAGGTPARRLGAVGVPVAWEGVAQAARDNQMKPGSNPAEVNPVYQSFRIDVEEIVPLVLAAAPAGNAKDWLAYDANVRSWLEFATLEGYQASPRIAFKLPDTRDADLGSFDNMTEAMKVVDVHAAKVIDATKVLRVAGA